MDMIRSSLSLARDEVCSNNVTLTDSLNLMYIQARKVGIVSRIKVTKVLLDLKPLVNRAV